MFFMRFLQVIETCSGNYLLLNYIALSVEVSYKGSVDLLMQSNDRMKKTKEDEIKRYDQKISFSKGDEAYVAHPNGDRRNLPCRSFSSCLAEQQ